MNARRPRRSRAQYVALAVMALLASFALVPAIGSADSGSSTSELLTNGGFESDMSLGGWDRTHAPCWMSLAFETPPIQERCGGNDLDQDFVFPPATPFAGSRMAEMPVGSSGDPFRGDDYIDQTVTVPDDGGTDVLSWEDDMGWISSIGAYTYAAVVTADHDVHMRERNLFAAGTSGSTGWVAHRADLTPYAGKTITVRFGVQPGIVGDYRLDAVSLIHDPIPRSAVPGEGAHGASATVSGNEVHFTVASPGDAPFNYRWSFGDGTTSTDPSPTHVYPAAGVYYLHLTEAYGNVPGLELIQAIQIGSSLPSHASPDNTAAPQVSGYPIEGFTLTSDHGDWDGSGLTFQRQWLDCGFHSDPDVSDPAFSGQSCVVIPGATGDTYTVSPDEVPAGDTVKSVVTATDDLNQTSIRYSAPTAPIGTSSAPTNTFPPIITGRTAVGQILTRFVGQWTNPYPVSDFGTQWLSCDSQNACTPIQGANGETYTLQSSDIGHTIEVAVTDTDTDGGSTTATSQPTPTSVVTATAPYPTTLPHITGSIFVGKRLTRTLGEWTNATSLKTQWVSCDPQTGQCTPIAGATGATYVLTEADVGLGIDVVVTATNRQHESSTATQPYWFGPVTDWNAPVARALPTITGGVYVGKMLKRGTGTWDNPFTPDHFTTQWYSCDPDSTDPCAPIPGATGASYVLRPSDLGRLIFVSVTDADARGKFATADSPPTQPVASSVAVNTALPVVSGSPYVGKAITRTSGTWANPFTPDQFTAQWFSCDHDGDCTPIPGATGASYVLRPADAGNRIEVTVTDTNARGESTSATSQPTDPITETAPVNTAPPGVSGIARVGNILKRTVGMWSNPFPPNLYTVQWSSCDQDTTCTPIPGATADSYKLRAADIGRRIEVTVIDTDARGQGASATSPPTDAVGENPPVNTTLPKINGIPRLGRTLSRTVGTWTGPFGPNVYTTQWLACDSSDDCTRIPDATNATYRLQPADAGKLIEVRVTDTNAFGESTDATGLPTLAVS